MRAYLSNPWIRRLRKIPPRILARILGGGLLALPFLAAAWLLSRWKIQSWSRPASAERFLRRHRWAFSDLDLSALRVESLAGGISNASFLWRCKTFSGAPVSYLAKIFLPIGSIWACLLPVLGPFPKIQAISRRARLAADVSSRNRLISNGIPVPDLLVADWAECVAVSRYLHGEPVTEILCRAEERDFLTEEDKTILWKCGALLGQIHETGLSVLDAQPANCFWVPDEDRVYVLDLEYATDSNARAWDFDFFLGFIAAQLSGELCAEAQEAVRNGYLAMVESKALTFLPNGRDLEGFLPVFQMILDLRSLAPEVLVGCRRPLTQEPAVGLGGAPPRS